jgi:uncharacterized membrane protein YvbJ
MEICANCGGDVLEGTRFCPHCGMPQDRENPARILVTEVPVERLATTPPAARVGIAALTIVSLAVIAFALLVLLGFFVR